MKICFKCPFQCFLCQGLTNDRILKSRILSQCIRKMIFFIFQLLLWFWMHCILGIKVSLEIFCTKFSNCLLFLTMNQIFLVQISFWISVQVACEFWGSKIRIPLSVKFQDWKYNFFLPMDYWHRRFFIWNSVIADYNYVKTFSFAVLGIK